MGTRAKGGTHLAALVRMAMPLCKQAEREHPRTGPGRKPDHPDWLSTMLIMIAVLKRKKSKSAQFRFIREHGRDLKALLGVDALPARSTYFDRYHRAHVLFTHAIRLQGEKAITEDIADPQCTAVDKSLVAARGPLWHKSDRAKNRIPKRLRGVDTDSTWGYSKHVGWVQGYSFEVAMSATKGSTVFPLQASASTACAKETKTFENKIERLSATTDYMLSDSGYDSNQVAEKIEWEDDRRRQQRRKFYNSPRGKRLYARRSQTVEPFNEWFKSLFELEDHVWHRGLQNNQTQILAATFVYQLLVRYNYRKGNENGQIRWIIDSL